jgi:glycosyltransferase involved in cell wall biosynthesis
MRSLEVIGPFKGSSGYDRHTREFVREFVRQGVQVQLVNLDGWSVELPHTLRETWFDRLDAPVGARTVLHFTMPNQGRPCFGKRNVNYTMFEADRIPQAWVNCAFAHDLIVLPTEAAYRAWADSGVPEARLRLCPLGVNADHFAVPAEPAPLTLPDGRPLASIAARFLNIAELRPRKNHLGLLRAWMNATHRDDDAVLLLKASVFQSRVLPQFQADVWEMQQQTGKSLTDAAPILVIAETLPNEMVRSLYASATHYISMSHGEGWDQPMMEAAVSGLQLIAPRHSAYLTYLTDAEAHFIPAPAGPARFEGRLGIEDQIFFDGLSWWNPDEDAAADLIRAIVSCNAESKRSPKERIAAQYTWARAAERLLEITLS